MGDYSGYDFGRSRKEKYVGKGTGSILTTPNQRKGYTKSGSPRMKISEKNTWKRAEDADKSMPSPKPADVSGQFAERSVEPTSHEISRAVRRLEDNPGLHQAYVGKSSGSQSLKARKLGMWDGSIKGDFPRKK